MKHFDFGGGALSGCLIAAMLAGCGAPGAMQSSGTTPAFTHGRPFTSAAYTVLYRFHKPMVNGAHPQAGLIDVSDTFYGTTANGGASGRGTVYSIGASGSEKVLHSFGAGSDGSGPRSELVNVNGTLYGTTHGGGYGSGTVYSITTSGAENVLYAFPGGIDGYYPDAELIDLNGTLYGTTIGGGVSGCYCGTVFSISTAGKHTVLHDFGPTFSDGSEPRSGLTAVNGTLYGTTAYGGLGCSSPGCGTVYSITTSGVEKVLYAFTNPPDGVAPTGTLVNVNGTLYGTTSLGGASNLGTVFSISTSGSEKVLYSFTGGTDGEHPVAGLINVNGTLYGTTVNGGGSGCTGSSRDCGTLFSISTSGAEKVLHSFSYDPDGTKPMMRLLNVNGMLYGTTASGGRGCPKSGSCGVVFAVTP